MGRKQISKSALNISVLSFPTGSQNRISTNRRLRGDLGRFRASGEILLLPIKIQLEASKPNHQRLSCFTKYLERIGRSRCRHVKVWNMALDFCELLYSGPHRKATSKLVLRVRAGRSQTPANANHKTSIPTHLNLSNVPQSSKSRSHGSGGGCSAGNCQLLCRGEVPSLAKKLLQSDPADICRRTIQCMLLQRRSCGMTCSSRFPPSVS
jgi:hypothetical protein